LNEQVRRNIERFPKDFAFRLTREEFDNLISQIATSRPRWGGRRKLPNVFTEQINGASVFTRRPTEVQRVSTFVSRAPNEIGVPLDHAIDLPCRVGARAGGGSVSIL